MASILEYALSLKTAAFNGPLKQSEAGLKGFADKALQGSNSLAGLAAGAAGAGLAIGTLLAVTSAAKAVLDSYSSFDGLVRGLKSLEGAAKETEARITLLRDVAKLPGLDFEGAVKGDIRLRSAGLSAALSEKALRAFGNAIATVGGGQEELQGITLALTQIASKGVVAAEEINQIAERVPQIRVAMKDAFGTANTEELQKMGIDSVRFIEGVVESLSKLPKVTAGAKTILENYDDSWKALKSSASEFAVGIAGSWITSVSGAFSQASRDLKRLKDLFGIKTPGLEGADGATDAQKTAEKAAVAQAEAARKASAAEIAAHNESVTFAEEKSKERVAVEKENAAARLEIEKKLQAEIVANQEKVYAARLSQEENLKRRIANLQGQGPSGAAAINGAADLGVKKQISDRTAELVALEKELKELRASAAEKAESAAAAARAKAEAASKEVAAQQLASDLFNQDNAILEARANKNNKLVTALEKQAKLEALKRDLMREQGLSSSQAAEAAKRRIELEERAAKPRRGLLDVAASAAARLQRRSAADAGRNGDGLGNTDRLAIAELERRKNRPLSPARAAEQLAGGNAAADPGRNRREERAEAKLTPDQSLLKAVKDIAETFTNLAKA